MSQETLQTNQVEQGGLTHEQSQQAIELRSNIAKADDRMHDTLAQQDYRSRRQSIDRAMGRYPKDPASVIGLTAVLGVTINAGERALDRHGVKKAQRRSDKHYRKNQAAYVEQAENQATEAGVELNR